MDGELNYGQLCRKAEEGRPSRSAVFFYGDEPVLAEDLIAGWVRQVRSSVEGFSGESRLLRENIWTVQTGAELLDAFDAPVFGGSEHGAKVIIGRDADRFFTGRQRAVLMTRIERQRRTAGHLTLLSSPRALSDDMAEKIAQSAFYGRIRPPDEDMAGKWVATKSLGLMAYTRKGRTDRALIPEQIGIEFMEWVGWDWAAALTGIRAVRTIFNEPVTMREVRAIVPQVVGEGYVDALVFGKPDAAMRIAPQINPADFRRVLGLVRFHLRRFGVLRAAGAANMSAREVEKRTGISVWRWAKKYRPRYAGYTDDRIQRRLADVSRIRAAVETGARVGVLEALAASW